MKNSLLLLLGAGLLLSGCGKINSTINSGSVLQEEQKDWASLLDHSSIQNYGSYTGIALAPSKSQKARGRKRAYSNETISNNQSADNSNILVGRKADGSFEEIEFSDANGKNIGHPKIDSFRIIKQYSGGFYTYFFYEQGREKTQKFNSNFALINIPVENHHKQNEEHISLVGDDETYNESQYLLDFRTGLIYAYHKSILRASTEYLYGDNSRLTIKDNQLVEERFDNLSKIGMPDFCDNYGNCLFSNKADGRCYVLEKGSNEISIFNSASIDVGGRIYVKKDEKSDYELIGSEGKQSSPFLLPHNSSLELLYSAVNEESYYIYKPEDSSYYSYFQLSEEEENIMGFVFHVKYSADGTYSVKGVRSNKKWDDPWQILIRHQFGYDQNACLSGTKMYFLSDNKVITFDVLTAQFEELASFGDNLIITQFYRDPIGRLLFDGTNTKLETIRGEVLSDGTISFDIQELNYSVQIYYPINN